MLMINDLCGRMKLTFDRSLSSKNFKGLDTNISFESSKKTLQYELSASKQIIESRRTKHIPSVVGIEIFRSPFP
ncbi:hypothetical protein D3C80_1629440 [compost metagenome]